MDTSLVEEIQQAVAALAPNRLFFVSPYRSFMASGCLARFDEPAVGGDSPDSPFQQKLSALFADAKAQDIKNPVMIGVISFDPHQPSSPYILESWQSFSRRGKQASTCCLIRSQLLNMMKHQAIPEQTTLKQTVARTVTLTATPQVDKVVLSRLIDITTDTTTDSGILLERLITQDPISYNSRALLTDDGVPLGASPELLLRKGGGRFSPILLAGSARRQPGEVLDREASNRLLASEKDHHEHELTTRAMREVPRKRSSELHVPSPPQLITTPTLWYLAISFKGKAGSQENALTLAHLLHPTPVLSGFPHQATTWAIAGLEPLDHGLFSGIVGWYDSEGNGEQVVTTRCTKLRKSQVCLFTGMGIMSAFSSLDEQREAGIELSTVSNAFGLH